MYAFLIMSDIIRLINSAWGLIRFNYGWQLCTRRIVIQRGNKISFLISYIKYKTKKCIRTSLFHIDMWKYCIHTVSFSNTCWLIFSKIGYCQKLDLLIIRFSFDNWWCRFQGVMNSCRLQTSTFVSIYCVHHVNIIDYPARLRIRTKTSAYHPRINIFL